MRTSAPASSATRSRSLPVARRMVMDSGTVCAGYHQPVSAVGLVNVGLRIQTMRGVRPFADAHGLSAGIVTLVAHADLDVPRNVDVRKLGRVVVVFVDANERRTL